ncbi:MAG: prepilin-type N-terminal cleavage/methylation domain-containing protein [Phycisphaerales bacterium]|nr:prepilin-type N-terminal cleavage/methylation domain-containing protein [Phycisphaerales bacterium]
MSQHSATNLHRAGFRRAGFRRAGLRRASFSRSGGFTLIELLIVIAIIGILAGLALVIGRQVSEGGRASVTRDLLRIMSQSLDATLADRDGKLSWKYVDESTQKNEFAIFDGRLNPSANRGDPTQAAEPTVALLLLATKGAASIESAVGGLDSKFVTRAAFATTNPSGPTDTRSIYTRMTTSPRDASNAVLSGLVIKDPWGNPIRFAHPKFFGGTGPYFRDNAVNGTRSLETLMLRFGGNSTSLQTRRSLRPFTPSGNLGDLGDSDEGLLDGGRGYFYSVGPDRDPGTRGDNVYIDPVKYPTETEKLK